VAAVSSLIRVTPSGQITNIAKAPPESQWMSVVQEQTGSFLVVDNRQHGIWRVSQDGHTTTKLLSYAAPNPVWEGTSIVPDGNGNYLLLEDHSSARLFRVTPAGDLGSISLKRSMAFCWSLTPDGPANYLAMQPYVSVAEEPRGTAIVRIAENGEVIELAKTTARPNAVVRDPDGGGFIGISNYQHLLFRISPDGQTVVSLAFDPSHLAFPSAIIVDTPN